MVAGKVSWLVTQYLHSRCREWTENDFEISRPKVCPHWPNSSNETHLLNVLQHSQEVLTARKLVFKHMTLRILYSQIQQCLIDSSSKWKLGYSSQRVVWRIKWNNECKWLSIVSENLMTTQNSSMFILFFFREDIMIPPRVKYHHHHQQNNQKTTFKRIQCLNFVRCCW